MQMYGTILHVMINVCSVVLTIICICRRFTGSFRKIVKRRQKLTLKSLEGHH